MKKMYWISKEPAFVAVPLLFKGKRYECSMELWSRDGMPLISHVKKPREARAATGTV